MNPLAGILCRPEASCDTTIELTLAVASSRGVSPPYLDLAYQVQERRNE